MRFFLICLGLLLVHYISNGQTSETIRSGRPAQAFIPYAVGKSIFQNEIGFSMSGFNEEGIDEISFVPTTTLRFGVTEKVEINTTLEFRHDNYHHKKTEQGETIDSTSLLGGLSSFSLGTRINFHESNNYIPSVAMQVGLKLPFVSSEYKIEHVAPQIFLIVGQKITDKIGLTANLGLDWTGNGIEPFGVYILNLSYTFSPKWYVFAETYGLFKSDLYENRYDIGVAFVPNNNIQIDLFGGLGDNHQHFDYFVSAGLSWRIKRNQK